MLEIVKFRKGYRNPAARLRRTVELLPLRTRSAMLRGIDSNRIIVGAYADSESGGICPMLAAHRNGGRTDLSTFARAWDCFTGARKPRRATRREVTALRGYLEVSLIDDGVEIPGGGSISEAAARIRSERSEHHRSVIVADTVEASRERIPAPQTGDRDRGSELRDRPRWSWLRPTRRYDTYRNRLAAASEQLNEQRADEVLSDESDRGAAEIA
jgi:hypothetical protein